MSFLTRFQWMLAAAVMFSLWAALVFCGLAPVADLVNAIKIALGGVIVAHLKEPPCDSSQSSLPPAASQDAAASSSPDTPSTESHR